jgi:hypothetical protein
MLGNGADTFDVTGMGPEFVYTTAQLPEDLTCEHCVLRVFYRAGRFDER